MTIEHFVFDVGRVLLHWDREIPFRKLIPGDEARQQFLDTVCTLEWNLEQDQGREWSEGEAILIEKFPDHEDMIRAYRAHWHEMVPHHHEVSADLMMRLISEGRDVTLLTNFAADTFAEVSERFDFLTCTRGTTVSGEIGLLKPEPEIYQHHQRVFDLDPAATLFLDDSPQNVKGARDVGWQAVEVANPAEISDLIAPYL